MQYVSSERLQACDKSSQSQVGFSTQKILQNFLLSCSKLKINSTISIIYIPKITNLITVWWINIFNINLLLSQKSPVKPYRHEQAMLSFGN